MKPTSTKPTEHAVAPPLCRGAPRDAAGTTVGVDGAQYADGPVERHIKLYDAEGWNSLPMRRESSPQRW
jgi:hypothetical protein